MACQVGATRAPWLPQAIFLRGSLTSKLACLAEESRFLNGQDGQADPIWAAAKGRSGAVGGKGSEHDAVADQTSARHADWMVASEGQVEARGAVGLQADGQVFGEVLYTPDGRCRGARALHGGDSQEAIQLGHAVLNECLLPMLGHHSLHVACRVGTQDPAAVQWGRVLLQHVVVPKFARHSPLDAVPGVHPCLEAGCQGLWGAAAGQWGLMLQQEAFARHALHPLLAHLQRVHACLDVSYQAFQGPAAVQQDSLGQRKGPWATAAIHWRLTGPLRCCSPALGKASAASAHPQAWRRESQWVQPAGLQRLADGVAAQMRVSCLMHHDGNASTATQQPFVLLFGPCAQIDWQLA